MFTLRQVSTGFYPGLQVTPCGGRSFSNPYSAEAELWFSADPDLVWVVSSRHAAENLLSQRVAWYNSSVERPEVPNNVPLSDLEVVELVALT